MEDMKDLIVQVLTHYDLGELEEYDVVKGGYVNNNLKVKTTKGVYFFREYKHFYHTSRIKRANEFLIELKEKNFPVAAPYLTKEGENYVELDSKVFSIFEFIEGEDYDFSEKQFLNAAKTLAKFHKKVKDLPTDDAIIKSCHNVDHIKNLWHGGDSILSQIEATEMDPKFKKELIDAVDRLKHHFHLFEKDDLPYVRKRDNVSILHGDFWHGQMIFHESEVAALIDFDSVLVGYREYDLVKGMRSFITVHHHGFDLDKIKKFLKAYKEVFGEIDLEPREVIGFLRHALFEITRYHLVYSAFKKQDEHALDIVKYHLEELDWIQHHEHKIIKAFDL